MAYMYISRSLGLVFHPGIIGGCLVAKSGGAIVSTSSGKNQLCSVFMAMRKWLALLAVLLYMRRARVVLALVKEIMAARYCYS